jgi:hypothetical protein
MYKQAVVGIALSLLTASATPALAQSQPFQGLFGAHAGAAPDRSLNLETSLFGVYDTHPPKLFRNLTTGTSTPDIYYSDLHTSLWYTRRGQGTSFAAHGTSALQYYPQLAHIARWSGAGAVALRKTTRRVRFGVDQEARYSPYAHLRAILSTNGSAAGLADVAAPDVTLAVSGWESYQYNTTLNADYDLTPRTTLNSSYHYEYLDFVPVNLFDWKRQDASLSFTHSLTAKTAFVAGYTYHRRNFQGDRVPLSRQDINVGVNYNSALPFSPQTTFTFAVGSTGLSRNQTLGAISNNRQFIRLTGNADLEHQLGQSWHVGVFYIREVQYIEGISDIFLADSVTGNMSGFLTPRIELQATSGYATAPLRFGTRRRAYDTNASTAQVRIAISRGLAVQAEYVYYRYVFSNAVTLQTGTPARENRHVFRVGLTTWFPFLQ